MNLYTRLAPLLFCSTLAATIASEYPMGHPNFYPSSDRPIGWRGDGSGWFPGARPVFQFGITPILQGQEKYRDPRSKKMKTRTIAYYEPQNSSLKNVVWSTMMPGFSHSQPIIIGHQAITLADPWDIISVDMHSGKIQWQRSLSPYALQGLPEKEQTLIVDFIQRLRAARAYVMPNVGGYTKLPKKWSLHGRGKIIIQCGEQAANILEKLANEHAFGQHAQASAQAMRAFVKEMKTWEDGATIDDKAGNRFTQPILSLMKWIAVKYGIPVMHGWDGYIGWTFASPASDGKRIYVSMGQGQVAACALDGTLVWSHLVPRLNKKLQPISAGQAPSSVKAKHVPSPMLAGNTVIFQTPDQLIGCDVDDGTIRWRRPEITASGYRVGSGRTFRLESGRWIMVCSNGMIIDAATGTIQKPRLNPCRGAEGGGISVVGSSHGGRHAYISGSASNKRANDQMIWELSDADGSLSARQILHYPGGPRNKGFTPVVTDTFLYRFSGKVSRGRNGERHDPNVFDLRSNTLAPTGVVLEGINSMSPIIAGTTVIYWSADGTRHKRNDKKNLTPIYTAQVDGLTLSNRQRNYLDESELHRLPAFDRYIPDSMKTVTSPLIGDRGGFCAKFGYGSPYAHGNRLLIRSVGSLICIGDPETPFDGIKGDQ